MRSTPMMRRRRRKVLSALDDGFGAVWIYLHTPCLAIGFLAANGRDARARNQDDHDAARLEFKLGTPVLV